MKFRITQTISSTAKMLVMSAALLLATSAQAMQSPDDVVKNTVDAMVDKIQTNRAAYQADTNKLFDMVEEVLIPTLHVDRMSKLILGKKNASKATAKQKKDFSNEFKTFMMRSYATALMQYTGKEKVTYAPLNLKEGADKAVVKASLKADDGQSYPISLYMSNRRDTQWRAYNVEVAGINFVSTYRATFADIIASKGIDGLIAELRAKNKKLAS